MFFLRSGDQAYQKGLWAETLAAWYLRLKGYRICAMRYKTPVGEIDIVARKGKALVFVEVKARGSLEEALQSIHRRNQSRVMRAAEHYIGAQALPSDISMRFDAVALAPPFSLRHLDNAWQAHT